MRVDLQSVPHSRTLWPTVMLATICALSIGPYLYVIELPLTAIDTVPTIAAARIDSIVEIPRVLLRELRGQADSNISYYRPLTLLTYSVDYSLWRWDSTGYHITDLLLHGLAAVSVYWMSRLAFQRRVWESCCIALLFVLHPATIEVVPAIARRQEPLLVIALAITLIGIQRLPKKTGWILGVVGAVMAVTTVERGLVISGLVWTYLFFYRLNGLALIERIKTSLKWSAPFILISIAFYLFRYLQFGGTGIKFSLKALLTYPLTATVMLLYPQQPFDLKWPASIHVRFLVIVLAILVAGVVARAILRSDCRGLYMFGAFWILQYFLLFSIAGQVNPWYTYTAVAPLALVLVTGTTESLREWKGARWKRPSDTFVACFGIAIALSLIQASPAIREYNGWKVAGQLTKAVTEEVLLIADRLPAGKGLVLINVPSHYKESADDYLVTNSAAILWPRSVLVWLTAHDVHRKVVVLGSSRHVGTIDTPKIELVSPNRLQVYFDHGGSSYDNHGDPNRWVRRFQEGQRHGVEFEWPPEELTNTDFEVMVFDGRKFVEVALPTGSELMFTCSSFLRNGSMLHAPVSAMCVFKSNQPVMVCSRPQYFRS